MVLGLDPEGPVPTLQPKATESSVPTESLAANPAQSEMVPVSEHPKYNKYFKMLKVGLPKEMVKSKMTQEGGINPDFLDKDPAELVPLDETKHSAEADHQAAAAPESNEVPVSEHPKYSKYFRMLKVGLPATAVKAKMEQEGVDPSILDKDPSEMVPLEPVGVQVPVSEHPKYVKYFKMMKVGLPKDAIQAKMVQEGVNPSYLDKDPAELVPLDESQPVVAKSVTPVKKQPKVIPSFIVV